MELDLLYDKFADVEKSLTLEEAKEKAHLFLDSIDDDDIEDLGGDYWIQISKEWDLNIWWGDDDDTSIEMTLYPCKIGEDGYFHTDTIHDGIKVM